MHFEGSKKIEAKSVELEKSELTRYVELGYFKKHKNREEHVTIHPCWLNDIKAGISAELSSSLGQWNQKLTGYLIGYEKPKLKSKIGAVNEDHKWIHIDICATFYVYQPEVDHVVKGIIQKKGNAAAICTVFNVFTVTVFAADSYELESWSVGDEIEFTIYSFVNRRKGPILRARSFGCSHNYQTSEQTIKQEVEENLEVEQNGNDNTYSYPTEEMEVSPSKKKKKKRNKNTEDQSLSEEIVMNKKIKLELESFEEFEESAVKKAKKKKKKKDKHQEYE